MPDLLHKIVIEITKWKILFLFLFYGLEFLHFSTTSHEI